MTEEMKLQMFEEAYKAFKEFNKADDEDDRWKRSVAWQKFEPLSDKLEELGLFKEFGGWMFDKEIGRYE